MIPILPKTARSGEDYFKTSHIRGSSPPSILKIATPRTPSLRASATLSLIADASLHQSMRRGPCESIGVPAGDAACAVLTTSDPTVANCGLSCGTAGDTIGTYTKLNSPALLRRGTIPRLVASSVAYLGLNDHILS